MSEMVERVARAIQQVTHPHDPFDDLDEAGKEGHRSAARAAIEAMREPTAAMVKARCDRGHEIGADIDEAWRIMIDEALK